MSLRATTLLGANTVPILRDLLETIETTAGAAVAYDDEMPLDEREQLVRDGAVDLVFACGLLTAEMIRDGVPIQIVAAPIFPEESAAVYRSVIVARQDSAVGSVADGLSYRLAVNEYGSWSGWRAYERHLEALGRSADEHPTTVLSGGHARSVAAVRDGVADIAAIDSSIWRALPQEDRRGLVVIDTTKDWPAPPLSLHTGVPAAVRSAVDAILGNGDWHAARTEDYAEMIG
jgi:ABC-type phosphate/phosphonate transport system substrate-binding protein